MRITTAFLMLFVLSSSAWSLDGDLMPQIRRNDGFFDGGQPFEGFIPSVPVPEKGGNGPAAPKWPGLENSGPVKPKWLKFRDAFKEQGEACMIVDVVYVRQPSLKEALESIAPCLEAISAAYKVPVRAVAGDAKIVLTLGAILPSGSTLPTDLEHALQLRKGQLLGHPTRLVRLDRPENTLKSSSLQFVVDRCPTISVVRPMESGKEFLSAYGNCIMDAAGLDVTDVLPHPTDSGAIVVFSKAKLEAMLDMNGLITVPGAKGPAQILVSAQRELLIN